MKLTDTLQINKAKLSVNAMWLIVGVFAVLIIAKTIADFRLVYLGILLLPLLIFLAIQKPVIFPFGVYVFFIPFDPISSITSGNIFTLTKLLGILTMLILFVKGIVENKFIKPNRVAIWWVLFILYGLLTVSWAINPEKVINSIPTAMGLLIFYLLVASYQFKKEDYETLKWFILLGGIVAAIVVCYGYTIGKFYGRASLMFGDRIANPNGVAIAMLIPLSLCVEKLLRKNKKIVKVLYIISFALLVYAIIITGSRKALLGVGLILIVYQILSSKKMSLSFVVIVIGIGIMQFIPHYHLERWGAAVETGAGGRLDIWYVGLQSLKKYWLSGAGLSNFPEAFTEHVYHSLNYVGIQRVAHNEYLKTIVELGIMGFMLFVIAIWNHYRLLQTRIIDMNKIMLKASFWAILMIMLSADVTWNKSYWLLWMMIVIDKNLLNQIAETKK